MAACWYFNINMQFASVSILCLGQAKRDKYTVDQCVYYTLCRDTGLVSLFHYGPETLRKVSSTLLNVCYKELRQKGGLTWY